MQFLCIEAGESSEDIKDYINRELNKFDIDCFIENVVNSEGKITVKCKIDLSKIEEERQHIIFDEIKAGISSALADYIIKEYEEKLIYRIINNNYCYFNSLEKKEIFRIAVSTIKNSEKSFLNSLFQIRRRNIIIRKLLDYYQGANDLILDGFVNFRLKEYIKDLEEIVDKAVDDFLMEREYREFIRLLRYFVDIQEPKFNTIHVIAGYDDKYILLDENKREITNECIQEFMNDISSEEIKYDDLLVSSLITMAPRKIMIHGAKNFKNKELLETIKNVFWEKTFICAGCELCIVNMVRNEEKV
ncbi:putative sporulation protein YtxC [Acetivibrio saccincola]|jgi:putative sporulation protein YtxC|uniref:YtxC-like family protein n=1 Tax=Acetivibrio saccincola TaxID=1677857 RepID=A0A2K9E5P7_9FIRM|nr:putative sporulation protein YtxC [Acetivibrio saccincola]AUG59042.1 YtxC-like family protein [Acetivibrio saccincola]NLW26328.1 putative sporulation protein YtxC [Acetivibrio saccincola]HOA97121.1 putative sporulation protein YtxC [Acetivibrio saccincola]HQD28817.1 putative sporulation protein YtxC [Acetivibrio saccincola]